MQRVQVFDSHTGGEPTRVVIAGGPDLGHGPLAVRRERFRTEFDRFRSAVVNEPRGSDVLVGALAGALTARAALAAYVRDGWFQNCMDAFARGFLRENSPYCYFLYAVVIVFGIEAAMHFQHLFEVLNHTLGDLAWHIKRGRLTVN